VSRISPKHTDLVDVLPFEPNPARAFQPADSGRPQR
jgi:hypothetical protein